MPWLQPRLSGAGARDRTADLLITNQLLYRLSYASVRWWVCDAGWNRGCAPRSVNARRLIADATAGVKYPALTAEGGAIGPRPARLPPFRIISFDLIRRPP